MKMTGSQIIMEILLEQGVDTVFGYPGGAALNIYDTLYQYSDRIRHVLTAHEQGAAHAADGYARATGKTGVVFATSGPGATNLVTGIATAFMDSIPMVAITSNVANSLIGRDAFQEVYITGITMPITKHNFFVNKIEDLAHAVREAFRIAATGRKGPVLVDVTKDVSAALYEFEPKEAEHKVTMSTASDEEIQKIADMINQAERPAIYCGGGVPASDAGHELTELIHKADIPIAYTMMAVGIVGYNDTHSLGMIGMHGSVAANKAVDQADLVLALGTRFSDRVALNTEKFAHRATKVQVDIDESEINKNVIVDMSVISDVKYFLEKLLPLVEEKKRTAWLEQVAVWRDASIASQCPAAKMHPRDIIGAVCDMTDKETIYVTDVGQHQMWAAQYYKYKTPRTLLTSGGLGTMGYGLGAAIGAKMGRPDKTVVNIAGDGCFRMNMNEIATSVRSGNQLIEIVLNNHVLGMVRQWQTLFYDHRYSHTILNDNVDFVKLAEAMGAEGIRVTKKEEVEPALKKALASKGTVVLDCWIDQDLSVFPMVPAGANIDDVFDEEDMKKDGKSL